MSAQFLRVCLPSPIKEKHNSAKPKRIQSRKGKLREKGTYLHTTSTDVSSGKKQTVVVTVDLKFQSIQQSAIQTAERTPCTIILTRWLTAALYKRKVVMRLGNWISTPKQEAIRLPQVFPLSAVLYNVDTNGLADLNSIIGLSRSLRYYLDDGRIYKIASDAHIAVTAVQELLENCHNGSMRQDRNESKQGKNPRAHLQKRSITTSNARSLLQRKSQRTNDQPQTEPRDPQNLDAKAGLSALKAMVAKGIGHHQLLLLYQSVELSVNDYDLGLTTL